MTTIVRLLWAAYLLAAAGLLLIVVYTLATQIVPTW